MNDKYPIGQRLLFEKICYVTVMPKSMVPKHICYNEKSIYVKFDLLLNTFAYDEEFLDKNFIKI